MKFLPKILIVVVVLVIIAYAGAAVFIASAGKGLIAAQIEQATKKKVSIGSVRLLPLCTLELTDLNVEKLIKADRISVSPSIILLLTGRIGLNSVVIRNPQLSFEINPPMSPESLEKTAQEAVDVSKKDKAKTPDIFIKRFVLTNGTVDFFDKTVGAEGIRILAKGFNCTVSNAATFASAQATVFDVQTEVPWQQDKEKGTVKAAGRLNLAKKEIQATVAVNNIDAIALYPYYAQWIDLKEVRFDKARLNFSSDIQGAGNNVIAKCRIELTDIQRAAPKEGEDNKNQIADLIMGFAQAAGKNKLKFDFTIKTGFDKLDKLGLSGIKLGGAN